MGSVTYTNGYVTSTSLSVSFSATDAGSGVNSAGGQLMRRSATLSSGNCGSYGSFTQVGSTGLSSALLRHRGHGQLLRLRVHRL